MALAKKCGDSGKGGFLRNLKSLTLLLLFAPSLSWASSELSDIWRNNQAAKHMQQQKLTEAHEEFQQLLADKPFHPLFQFNLGTSFIGVEEFEKAIQMYNEVLKIQPLPPEIEYAALYNLGVLHSMKGGDIEKALENYQKALAFNPQSKEIKTNIELLLKGGKGKGKGDSKDKNKNQQDQNSEDGEQPQEPQEFTNKQQPNQFNSKDMSKSDVKKILEELKKQEQRIRAKHDRKGGKEADRAKNW